MAGARCSTADQSLGLSDPESATTLTMWMYGFAVGLSGINRFNPDGLAKFDFWSAKARLAGEMDATRAELAYDADCALRRSDVVGVARETIDLMQGDAHRTEPPPAARFSSKLTKLASQS